MRIKVPALLRIDRYVLFEVCGPFLGGVLFFTFVFLMFQALRLADFFIIHGVPLLVLGKLVMFMTLSFLPIVLPIALLIALLVGFGRLSSESEIIAMKSSGMSLTRISAPVFGFSFLILVGSLLLNLDWVPKAERAFKSLLIRVSNTKAVSSVKEGTFTSGFFDLLIYADKANPKTNRMERIFIFDEREPKNPLIIVSQEGRVIPVKTSNALGAAAVLSLSDGNIHRNDVETETYQRMNFREYSLYLNVSDGEDNSSVKAKMLSYRTILDRIKDPRNDEHMKTTLRIELWRRYAVALSTVAFVFLGIGFGTVRTRSVKAGAAAITFLVLIGYYTLQILGTSMSYKETLPPWLAMQLPNLIALSIGFIGFRRASW